ncbi:MAG TPA: acyltransferase [Candidatus Saccharimonadia bacterium]|jgi:peptidoglycan/LPS O-acetylase OafA/YrhL
MNDEVRGSLATFKNIDLEVLRSAAVILVVLNHSQALFPWRSFPLTKYFLSYGGVDIFFAISGYIITANLLRSLRNGYATPTILKSFWTKRVFRILPMAYLWTFIPILLALTFNNLGGFGSPANLFRDGIANVTETANFHWQQCFAQPQPAAVCGYGKQGQTPLAQQWSLSTEEQFYFIFPLLLLFLPRRRLVLGLAAIPIILIFFDRRHDLFVLRFDAIAVGVLLALAQTKQWYREYYPSFLEYRAVGPILLVALLLLVGFVPAWLLVPFTQTIIVVIAAMLVFIASFNANLFTRPFPWLRPFFLWLGDRSYGIYLIHVPAFVLASEIYWRMVGKWDGHAKFFVPIASAIIIFVLVEVSGALVERPLRRLGRRLAKEIEINAVPAHIPEMPYPVHLSPQLDMVVSTDQGQVLTK